MGQESEVDSPNVDSLSVMKAVESHNLPHKLFLSDSSISN